MNSRLLLRHRRGLCRALVLSITCLVGQAQAATDALINNINVNTAVDEFGTGAGCSLREAIQSANTNADFGGCNSSSIYGNDHINIPPGTYNLTSSASDENANVNADLDILESVTLVGAGPGEGGNGTSTSINGGASFNGRLVHVLGGTVTLQNMTIERGHLASQGAGAGLRSEPGTTTILTNVVGLNVADGNAGGILNRGTMTLNGSAVTNNQTVAATQGGGGIFNDDNATLTLNDSRVLDNTATVVVENVDFVEGGGGIFNDAGATLTLNNTTVDGNTADNGSLQVLTNGGGIFSAGDLTVTQSTISNNSSLGNGASGGGLFCIANNTMLVDHSLVTGNTGGGIDVGCHSLTIADSIISNNTLDGGSGSGGLDFHGAQGTITNTTINGNSFTGGTILGPPFGSGGGVSVETGSTLTIVDSTISGNHAGGAGGGMYTGGIVSLFNVTIAYNTSNADGFNGGPGGGIFVDLDSPNVVVHMRYSVLAHNLANNAATHDDCDGVIDSGGHNVVESDDNCLTGDLSDLSPGAALLGILADNGGPAVGASTSPIVAAMLTHMPADASPLVDGGAIDGCRDQNGAPLQSDQRGFSRPVDGPDANSFPDCDIGAVEAYGLGDSIFADSFE